MHMQLAVVPRNLPSFTSRWFRKVSMRMQLVVMLRNLLSFAACYLREVNRQMQLAVRPCIWSRM